MEIVMARGDLETRTFTLKNKNGTIYQTAPDEIYFTVKANAADRNYKFQKRLSDGGITFVETGKYQFTILPEDTDGLGFGTYDFDIELVKAPSLKKTFCGKLVIDKEVTHHNNEVISNG